MHKFLVLPALLGISISAPTGVRPQNIQGGYYGYQMPIGYDQYGRPVFPSMYSGPLASNYWPPNSGIAVPPLANSGASSTSTGAPIASGPTTTQTPSSTSSSTASSTSSSSSSTTNNSQAKVQVPGCKSVSGGQCVECKDSNHKVLLVDAENDYHACGMPINGCKVYDLTGGLTCKECELKDNGPFQTTDNNKKICATPIPECDNPDGKKCDSCKGEKMPNRDGDKCLDVDKTLNQDCKNKDELNGKMVCLPKGCVTRNAELACQKCENGYYLVPEDRERPCYSKDECKGDYFLFRDVCSRVDNVLVNGKEAVLGVMRGKDFAGAWVGKDAFMYVDNKSKYGRGDKPLFITKGKNDDSFKLCEKGSANCASRDTSGASDWMAVDYDIPYYAYFERNGDAVLVENKLRIPVHIFEQKVIGGEKKDMNFEVHDNGIIYKEPGKGKGEEFYVELTL
ncbi:hypothetical protein O9G_004584 [Rozella allomycis CSF55]|uniref:Uncharacterized protein n=1 Tax=Rozella allomycis (strain CSF55) TaxID=988480 RepID=A0A075B2K9_ROZAC|nr:hypothetical protein O9G_004584 [Rozella allomycis CSF55]|eukprot:EPZ36792.1 hypothetical protein O9G_004584 [Rozella allomycis CSF55]